MSSFLTVCRRRGVLLILIGALFAFAGTAVRRARALENPALRSGNGYAAGEVAERARGDLPPFGFLFREEYPAGIGHILHGPDHVSFVVALALVASGAWDLFKVVSFFTVAHALTLTLASLNVISIGPLGVAFIEFGVALSIAWVAFENVYYRGKTHHRSLLAFSFGLVHGYAFSEHFRASLVNVDLESLPNLAKFLTKVLAFNLGVDTGQLVIVYAAFLALWALRRRAGPARAAAWMPRVVYGVSGAIGMFGLLWMAERLARIGGLWTGTF